ncbi:MAG: ABC transporter ATP-binding protein [Actinomycetota bacterium]|nr:ABC transporter ATP-binding protein [Actinomycetota bacterium]
MGPGMGGMGGFRALHGLRTQDPSVKNAALRPGLSRRIARFARPYWRLLACFVLLLIADSATGVATPLLYRAIIDTATAHHVHNAHAVAVITELAIVVAALALFDVLLGVGERAISARVGEGLIYDMRSRVFAHVQEMSIAFFTRTQTGALVSRLNNDVLGAQQAFTDVLQNVVGNLFTVAFVLAAMLALSWKITLVSLVLVPLFIIPAKRFGRRLQRITREGYNLNAEMTTMMSERFNVAGALLVKLFGRPATERAAFEGRAARVRDIGVTQAMFTRVLFACFMLTAALGSALVYGWGGVLVVQHQLQIGTLVALTAYLGRLYAPLTSLSNVQVDVLTALVSFDRVFEVLDLAPMIREVPGASELPPGPVSLSFAHVDFAYPGAEDVSLASLESVAVLERSSRVPVLHDVSFEVAPGQMVALVGPSGAGKTTISHLVTRLYDPDGGSIALGGIDLRALTLESLQRAVGVVSQDAHLFHDSVRANLCYARPGASDEELREALAAAQVLELIEGLPDGLDTIVGDRGYRLSGGEKQRVAIARLLLKAPSLVVLDEATAHLDSESELAVQRALDRALVGRTSLVIAHRLSTIRAADQILVLERGRIAERGTHEELLDAGGLYAELYRTQFATGASPEPPATAGVTGPRGAAQASGA